MSFASEVVSFLVAWLLSQSVLTKIACQATAGNADYSGQDSGRQGTHFQVLHIRHPSFVAETTKLSPAPTMALDRHRGPEADHPDGENHQQELGEGPVVIEGHESKKVEKPIRVILIIFHIPMLGMLVKGGQAGTLGTSFDIQGLSAF